MRDNDVVLRIENLSVRFDLSEDSNVLSKFSLDVYNGDRIAVIGETGSGKSVMLCALLKILPKNAFITGSVMYGKKNLLELDEKSLNDIRGMEIAYVPQGSANSLNPLMKVGAQVGETLVVHRLADKKSAWKRAVELMKLFNIGDEENRADQYPHTFSGGMRQRALIAMGISTDARVILADEPTKGLDSRRIKMVEESFSLLKDRTYICVTHDLNFAKNISEKLCVMYSSLLIEEGNTEEVFKNPLHPYTEDIINAMPENGLIYKGESLRKGEYGGGCRYYEKCSYRREICMKEPPMAYVGNRKVRCWKYVED